MPFNLAQCPSPIGTRTLQASLGDWEKIVAALERDRMNARLAADLRRAFLTSTGPTNARRVTMAPALAEAVLNLP